jgi:hypothetical protein
LVAVHQTSCEQPIVSILIASFADKNKKRLTDNRAPNSRPHEGYTPKKKKKKTENARAMERMHISGTLNFKKKFRNRNPHDNVTLVHYDTFNFE